jgi:hypothetical protein
MTAFAVTTAVVATVLLEPLVVLLQGPCPAWQAFRVIRI